MLKKIKKNLLKMSTKIIASILVLFTLSATVSPILAASGTGEWIRSTI